MSQGAEWAHAKRLVKRKSEQTHRGGKQKHRDRKSPTPTRLTQHVSGWATNAEFLIPKSTSITWTAKELSSALWVDTQNSLPNKIDHQLPFPDASVLYCISTGWHRNSKYSRSGISCLFPTCQQKGLFWYLQERINLVFPIRSLTHPNDTYTHSHRGW